MLLTLVAWFITEGDIFSHAINATTQESMMLLGIDTRLLSTLRAIAVVGFVLMGRLKEDAPWEWNRDEKKAVTQTTIIANNAQQKNGSSMTLDEIEQFILTKIQQERSRTIVVETKAKLSNPNSIIQVRDYPKAKEFDLQDGKNAAEHKINPERYSYHIQKNQQRKKQDNIDQRVNTSIDETKTTSEEIENRLLQAYRELQKEKHYVSARALAQHAHIRRATCSQWLQSLQQDTEKNKMED